MDIPEAFSDLVSDQSRSIGFLATVMADGSPQVTPVWFDMEDGIFRVNTVEGRIKSRNMLERPVFAMVIVDPAEPYRYIQVRGPVVSMVSEGAVEHTHKLAKKYLGEDVNPWYHGEPRQIFHLQPESLSFMD